MGATYTSAKTQRFSAPKCHLITRVTVMNRLLSWIKCETDIDALILWLYGGARAGKSAIVHTLAEMCDKDGCLLATFFFRKVSAKRNNTTRFIATIAYQIFHAIPESRPHIEAAVDADHMIFHQSVDVQLARLIIEPLKRLHSTGFDFKDSPFVLIVEGLDECLGTDIQSKLVKSLAAGFRHSPLRIRILISSRPLVDLQSTFNLTSIQPHLSRLALSDEHYPEEDIYHFLKDSFEKIRREHPFASNIPSSWPSIDVLLDLTQKSSGQFIFASTTVKYIGGDSHQFPHRRSDDICRLQPPTGEKNMPYTELNSLYRHVLSNVDDMEAVKQVLGVLFIINPIFGSANAITSADRIDKFLYWQYGKTKICLSQLASVIECDTYGRISILHHSLSDFLLDPSRSHQFYLCRESLLGNCVALALRHMHQPVLDENGVLFIPSLACTFKC